MILLKKIAAFLFILCLLAGCSSIPIKDGGLAIDKNTTATLDDIGVAKVIRQF